MSSSGWWNPTAIAASLVPPSDLELTPFRAYSAIYYGHTRCSNNCANAQHEIACIRKSSVIVPSRGARILLRVSVSLLPTPSFYASSRSPRHFLLRRCTLHRGTSYNLRAYAIIAANDNIIPEKTARWKKKAATVAIRCFLQLKYHYLRQY